jgi:ribonuclease J
MTKLVFHGGVNEIGGNKILLEDKGIKIFLDFGMNFNKHSDFFTEFMPPRKCTCIRDLIGLGLLPKIKGIYRKDYCKHMGLDAKEKASIDGVLVSHGHVDHIGYIHFLRKEIPIHVSPETKAVMELFSRTGAGSYNEYLQVADSFKLIPKKRGDGLKRKTKNDGMGERNINTFEFEKSFKIGHLEIIPLRVDHSLPGATGFIIHTSEGTIIYTGDLRFHGRHKQWSHNFVEKVSNEEPDLLLTEGTRIKENTTGTEEYVQKKSTESIKGKKGLTIVNFPLRDTDRLLTFYNTSVSNNRKLIIEPRQAILLDLLKGVGVDELPSSNDNNIRIFYAKKSWGIIGRKDFPEEHYEKDYQTWEKSHLGAKNIITAEEISKNQEKYVMFMNYFQLNNLFDIIPKKGSVHIRSMCEPFNEDMELDQKRIDNWLKLFGLYPEHKYHASGHASGKHIFEMVEKIKPRTLIPIHTEFPKMFKGKAKNVLVVKGDKEYKI